MALEIYKNSVKSIGAGYQLEQIPFSQKELTTVENMWKLLSMSKNMQPGGEIATFLLTCN